MKVAAYLEFKDNAKEVIETYKSIFDAEIVCQYAFEQGMTDNPDLIGRI